MSVRWVIIIIIRGTKRFLESNQSEDESQMITKEDFEWKRSV